jgi:hypothetical protein
MCQEVTEDFPVGMPDGSILVVPQITVWHCRCGARWLSPTVSDAVDEFVRRGGSWKRSGGRDEFNSQQ